MRKRTSLIISALVLVVAGALCLIFAVFPPAPVDKARITVNYVDEYNRIARPANFDPNDNAAPYFEKAFELMADVPDDIKNLWKIWPGDTNEQELQTAKQWVESNRQALDYLKQAISKTYYWKPLEADTNELLMAVDSNELSRFRKATYLLCLEAKLMAHEGQIEPALQQLVGVYNMGTFSGGPKMLVEQLVGIAISAYGIQGSFDVLDKTNPGPDILRRFQSQMRTAASLRKSINFAAERMLFFDQVQRLFTDDGNGSGHLYGARFLENPAMYIRHKTGLILGNDEYEKWTKMNRRDTVELANKMYDYLDWAAGQSPVAIHNQQVDLDAAVAEMAESNYFLGILAPALARVHHISFRLESHTQGLLTTIAILRYKAEKGALPENLVQLVETGYLDEVLIDPFSGNPLVYKLSGDSFQLYSFAQDFDDDGGKHDPKWADKGNGDYVFWPVQITERIEKIKSESDDKTSSKTDG